MAVEISQKKGMNKLKFKFKPEYFEWEYSDGSSSGSANISYLAVPSESSPKIERNRWLMHMGFLWIGLAIFARIYQVFTGTNLGVAPFGMFGALVALWAYYRTLTFSVFDLGDGHLYILKDKKHDQIVQEIMNRRNEILRERYFSDDFVESRSVEEEKDILEWLCSEGVISNEEKEIRLSELNADQLSAGSIVESNKDVSLH